MKEDIKFTQCSNSLMVLKFSYIVNKWFHLFSYYLDYVYVYYKIVSVQVINFALFWYVSDWIGEECFGNHFVTISKVDTCTPPAFASDPLKRLSTSGDRESIGANTVNPSIDAALPSTLQSGMYSSASLGSGPAIHVEPEIVEVDGPSPIVTQFPEQESNFIRSPSPHGVWPKNSLYFHLCYLLYICVFSSSLSYRTAIPLICSLVPWQEKVLPALKDKIQRFHIMLMMKMETGRSTLRGVRKFGWMRPFNF